MRSSTSPAHAPTAPKLTKAIERVEGGHTDGIAVARLDRFGRTLVDGVQQIDRIHKAGGTFASVADGFDISTDTGRLVLRIMLSLAEFELDRVRSNWEDARARAVARGIHPCATPPFGYRRASDGRLEPDPDTAPLVAELYAHRSRGGLYGRSRTPSPAGHRDISRIVHIDVESFLRYGNRR